MNSVLIALAGVAWVAASAAFAQQVKAKVVAAGKARTK